MPNDHDEGGRIARQGLELAGRGGPAAGTTTADPQVARPRLSRVVQSLIERCELLQVAVRPGMPDVRLPGDIADAFGTAMTVLDERDDALTPGEVVQLNFALFALARLGTMLAPSDRPTANALATALAARLRARGAPMHSDLPGSHVIADSAEPAERLDGIQHAVQGRIEELLSRLEDRALTREQHEAIIAAEAPLIARLLREARPAVLAGVSTDVDDETFGATSRAIARLTARCRQLRVRQGVAMLDLIFDAEDSAVVTTGARKPRRRRDYYEDLNATDLDDDVGDHDEMATSGSDLAGQIVQWFESGSIVQAMLLNDLTEIIKEPPVKRDPSTLEKVIAYAVQSFIAILPAYVNDVMSGALQSWLAVKTPDAVSAPVVIDGYMPGPATFERSTGNARVASEIVLAAQPLLTRTATRDVQRAMRGTVSADDGQEAPARKSSGNGMSVASAFTHRLTSEAIADMSARIEAAPGLRRTLQLVPPSDLQVIFNGLKHRAEAKVSDLRAELVMRWSTVVSAATNGVDHDGTVAFGGNLQHMAENPGSLRIDVLVRTDEPQPPDISGMDIRRHRRVMPEVQTRRILLDGLGPTGVEVLKEAKRPLHEVAMHRVFQVDAIGADGVPYNVGRFEVGPEGQLDLGIASQHALAQIGNNQPVSGRDTSLGDVIAGVTVEDAERGARLILNNTGKTTADIR
jgi:hypothetical protein